MKKLKRIVLLLLALIMLAGCKADPVIGIMSQPESDKPNRSLYFRAPDEVKSFYIDTYQLVDGQWQSSAHYGISADHEMNEGVIHGTLKIKLQEDLSVNFEFSYAALHYFNSEPFEAQMKNTEAVFHKETQYDIVTDTPMPVMLITDGSVGELSVNDYNNPDKLDDCKMAQSIVLTFSTEELE